MSTNMPQQLSRPIVLMVGLALMVVAWQHIVGHTTSSAHTMETPPIILLSSISVCTAIFGYFFTMGSVSLVRCLLTSSSQRSRAQQRGQDKLFSPECEQLQENGRALQKPHSLKGGTHDAVVWAEGDAGSLLCESSEYEYSFAIVSDDDSDEDSSEAGKEADKEAGKEAGKRMPPGRGAAAEVLTLSMIWSGVYGLGLSTFFLSYILTMASTLATFSFVVGLYTMSLYEHCTMRVEALFGPGTQLWAGENGAATDNSAAASAAARLQRKSQEERMRSGMHVVVLLLALICLTFLGVHVSRIDMNRAGHISLVDVFMAVIFPMLTPILLKTISCRRDRALGRRAYHRQGGRCAQAAASSPDRGAVQRLSVPCVLATWEVSLPFAMAMCVLFIVSMVGGGGMPRQVRDHVARNIAAATTIIPMAWSLSMVVLLEAVFQSNMIEVLATVLVVASGREFTLHKSDAVVACMFVVAVPTFLLTLLVSNRGIMSHLQLSSQQRRRGGQGSANSGFRGAEKLTGIFSSRSVGLGVVFGASADADEEAQSKNALVR
jgi:hypothetical protein